MEKKGFMQGLRDAYKSPQATILILSSYLLANINISKYYNSIEPKEPEKPLIVAQVDIEKKQLENILLYHLDLNKDSLISKINSTTTSQKYSNEKQTYSEKLKKHKENLKKHHENKLTAELGMGLFGVLSYFWAKNRTKKYYQEKNKNF